MAEMKYMLDTCVCIDMIRGRWDLLMHRLRKHHIGEVCISSITLAELMFGAENSDAPEQNCKGLIRFCAPLRVVTFDGNAAVAYGKVRLALKHRKEEIGAMDILIAAHALAEEVTLITSNEREFHRVVGLDVENWRMPAAAPEGLRRGRSTS